MNIISLERNRCTGCGMCSDICPTNAIQMAPDENGFLIPVVGNNCIDCGKCAIACPSLSQNYNLKKTKNYYGVWAQERYRLAGGSGGVFPVLAECFIRSGAKVFAPAFSKNCIELRYECVDKLEDISRILKSKYVQSNAEEIYDKVKNCLTNGEKVLFSGCPCQVSGLYNYLQQDYDNLLTVDILCHGVPSPKAYQKFLEEIAENRIVKSVDFRDKTYGWGKLIRIEFENGDFHFDHYNGMYLDGFSSGLFIRESCYTCPYATIERVGDITLGDFWGVKELDKEYDDNKGTSLVACNTPKGAAIFNLLSKKGEFSKFRQFDYDEVVKHQSRYNAAVSRPLSRHSARKCFFYHLNRGDSFTKSYRYSQKAIMDYGIVGWWNETSRSNYGSTLTDYALCEYLENLGLSIAFISPPYFDRRKAGRFNKEQGYRMTAMYSVEEMKENNKYFDGYIVASDVLWYYNAFISSGYLFLLDFADESKKKISYSTSFGNTSNFFPEHEILNARYYMKRFDAVSVREIEAVSICRDCFDVRASQVLDPVFLCPLSSWEKLANNAKRKTKREYVFSYMLDPSEEKVVDLTLFAEKLGLPLISVTDRQDDRVKKEEILRECGIIEEATIEELIFHIKNAAFVISDSFHGLCFALIFKKPFYCLVNRKRGASRFETMAELLPIQDRLIESSSALKEYTFSKAFSIDNELIQMELDKHIQRSAKWLINAIDSPHKKTELDFQTLLGKELYDIRKDLNAISNLFGKSDS